MHTNPVGCLAESYHSAINLHLSDIAYDYRAPHNKQGEVETRYMRPTKRDCEVHMFPQTWSTTAMGLGGWGGNKVTTVYTVVVKCRKEHAVYFGGRFAYLVKNPNQLFHDDLVKKLMKEAKDAWMYEKEEQE